MDHRDGDVAGQLDQSSADREGEIQQAVEPTYCDDNTIMSEIVASDNGEEQQAAGQTGDVTDRLGQTASSDKAMGAAKFYGQVRQVQKRRLCKPSRYE
jgi:hypothetical protein